MLPALDAALHGTSRMFSRSQSATFPSATRPLLLDGGRATRILKFFLTDADRSVGPGCATGSVPAVAPSGSGASPIRGHAHDTKCSTGKVRSISEKQLEANRRNAQRSTGPRSDTGKQASRLNAMKHGLLAKEVVINRGDYKEDEHEFAQLLAELREQFEPVGVAEDLEVQKIVLCYWRKMRAVRFENGAVRRRTLDMRERDVNRASCLSFVLDANSRAALAGPNI